MQFQSERSLEHSDDEPYFQILDTLYTQYHEELSEQYSEELWVGTFRFLAQRTFLFGSELLPPFLDGWIGLGIAKRCGKIEVAILSVIELSRQTHVGEGLHHLTGSFEHFLFF